MTRHTLPDPEKPAAALRFWWCVREAHFPDYTASALRMWVGIAIAGSLSAVWALMGWAGADGPGWIDTIVALAMVAVAAWFPVEIPRSKYSMGAADAFIFTTLAVLGPSAAVLAAGLEGAIGAWRSTKRLTSRISTPMAAMAAMAVCGSLFQFIWTWLLGQGLTVDVAKLAALPVVSLVPLVLTSMSLMSTVTLKRGKWPQPLQWFADSAWMASLCVASALLAGVVQLGVVGHGSLSVAIIGVATLLAIFLAKISLTRTEAEHRAQDERILLAQREAELNHQRFVGAFANAAIGMAIVDRSGKVVRANDALCVLAQRAEGDLVGAAFTSMLHPGDLGKFASHARDGIASVESRAAATELRCIAADGTEVWVALHSGQFSDPEGEVEGQIYQLHDVTARRIAEQRLHHIAYHDSLTNLANRASFHNQVAEAVEISRLDSAFQFAILFLDLDRFKMVNDSLGHLAGNELLREVGKRLSCDLPAGDLVARLGGDEFAVLLLDQVDKAKCLHRAESMLASLSAPFRIQGHELFPIASAGLTFSDLGYRTVDELLRDADLAMYESKSGGPGRVAVFDRSMHARIADKLSLESDLRHAIDGNELSLAYQPLFSLDSHRLVGFEALARWTHPTRGAISPAVFIALAEEAGHIEALTAWALNKAVAQLAHWHRLVPNTSHLGVQVNISSRDLTQSRFVEQVLDVIQRHELAPNLLTLEITESVLMSKIELASEALGRLRATGVRLAMDDFGTGYSSLAYLSKLPIDSIKIDRSFVWAMDRDRHGIEIVRAVTHLGKSLGKKVVAEGIETQEQLARLRQLGVDHGQGYFLAKPLPAELVPALLLEPVTKAIKTRD
jgi:diguanylate cyclase (GGDEF)-like protein/PAS domain S-box-containing protein